MSHIGEFYQGEPYKPKRYDFEAESFEEYLYRLSLFIRHLYRGGTRDNFDIKKAIAEDRGKEDIS